MLIHHKYYEYLERKDPHPFSRNVCFNMFEDLTLMGIILRESLTHVITLQYVI